MKNFLANQGQDLEKYKKILEQVYIKSQGLLNLVNDPNFLPYLEELTLPRKVKFLAFFSLGFLLVSMLFRSWLMSKISKWYIAFVANLIGVFMFWGCIFYVIPSVVYGNTWHEFLILIYYKLAPSF